MRRDSNALSKLPDDCSPSLYPSRCTAQLGACSRCHPFSARPGDINSRCISTTIEAYHISYPLKNLLDRRSGASDEPMAAAAAVPFEAPPSLAVTMELPNRGPVRGLGVRAGVTLIVGGGFHGKTTLLKALELGVYNKV